MGKRKALYSPKTSSNPHKSATLDSFLIKAAGMLGEIDRELQLSENRLLSRTEQSATANSSPHILNSPTPTNSEQIIIMANEAGNTTLSDNINNEIVHIDSLALSGPLPNHPEPSHLIPSDSGEPVIKKKRKTARNVKSKYTPTSVQSLGNSIPHVEEECVPCPGNRYDDLALRLQAMLEAVLTPVIEKLTKIEACLDRLGLHAHHCSTTDPAHNPEKPPRTNDHVLMPKVSYLNAGEKGEVSKRPLPLPNANPSLDCTQKAPLQTNHYPGEGSKLVPRPIPPLSAPFKDLIANSAHVLGSMMITGTKILENLHLPPEATPLVLILEGVPQLKKGEGETYVMLKDKTSRWLTNNIVEGYSCCHHIIMVRRVRHIGPLRKRSTGDCVVINFNSSQAVKYCLDHVSGPVRIDEAKIIARPLGFFYRPPFIEDIYAQYNRNAITHPENPFYPRTDPPHENPFNVKVSNHFSPLYSLDSND